MISRKNGEYNWKRSTRVSEFYFYCEKGTWLWNCNPPPLVLYPNCVKMLRIRLVNFLWISYLLSDSKKWGCVWKAYATSFLSNIVLLYWNSFIFVGTHFRVIGQIRGFQILRTLWCLVWFWQMRVRWKAYDTVFFIKVCETHENWLPKKSNQFNVFSNNFTYTNKLDTPNFFPSC